jgi:hypothetical protein
MAKRPFVQVVHDAALYTAEYLPAAQLTHDLLPPDSAVRIRTLAWQKVALWLLPEDESAEPPQPKRRPLE